MAWSTWKIPNLVVINSTGRTAANNEEPWNIDS